MRTTLLFGSTLLVVLCSCTVGPWIVDEAQPEVPVTAKLGYDYTPFYRAFDNPWVGRSRDELLAALGPPDAIYEARHWYARYDADIPASTYVYTRAPGSSGRCVDAYVVDQPTATVIKYYCR